MAQERSVITTNFTLLTQEAGCFGNLCVDPRQREALLIVLLNIVNSVLTQGDLKTVLELSEDAKCYKCLSPVEQEALVADALYRFTSQLAQDLPEQNTTGVATQEVFCLSCPGTDMRGMLTSQLVLFLYNLYIAKFAIT